MIRAAADDAGRPLALVADLQGPKLRIGDLPAPRQLVTGEEVVVAPEDGSTDGELPISPAVIGEVLTAGNDVLIDDGLVRLRVEEVEHGRARCRVLIGGVVSSHKGVNLPGVAAADPLADARRTSSDLELALELGGRLRRALVRAFGRRRARAARADRRVGLARGGDREDREGRGGRRARRDPRGDRRDHGRPRRPRRRDRPGRRCRCSRSGSSCARSSAGSR